MLLPLSLLPLPLPLLPLLLVILRLTHAPPALPHMQRHLP